MRAYRQVYDDEKVVEMRIGGKPCSRIEIDAYNPPDPENPYWEIKLKDGATIVTDETITIAIVKKIE